MISAVLQAWKLMYLLKLAQVNLIIQDNIYKSYGDMHIIDQAIYVID